MVFEKTTSFLDLCVMKLFFSHAIYFYKVICNKKRTAYFFQHDFRFSFFICYRIIKKIVKHSYHRIHSLAFVKSHMIQNKNIAQWNKIRKKVQLTKSGKILKYRILLRYFDWTELHSRRKYRLPQLVRSIFSFLLIAFLCNNYFKVSKGNN